MHRREQPPRKLDQMVCDFNRPLHRHLAELRVAAATFYVLLGQRLQLLLRASSLLIGIRSSTEAPSALQTGAGWMGKQRCRRVCTCVQALCVQALVLCTLDGAQAQMFFTGVASPRLVQDLLGSTLHCKVSNVSLVML